MDADPAASVASSEISSHYPAQDNYDYDSNGDHNRRVYAPAQGYRVSEPYPNYYTQTDDDFNGDAIDGIVSEVKSAVEEVGHFVGLGDWLGKRTGQEVN